ncbi:Uncharacterised protein [Escherichia coli]|uniref:Uncharacterized protein n=1 Tax=Escherichia coli TaxID=562 RepID=A0A377D9Z0_ECOLX|nr:Uncharacterised protein [Escherichia coli]
MFTVYMITGGTGFIKFKNGIIGIIKSNSSSEFNICFEIDIACKMEELL